MQEMIKCYVTVRFALSEKLALKTPNYSRLSLILRYILKTIDDLLRYGTLENSDKCKHPSDGFILKIRVCL